MGRKLTIEEMQEIARSRGGECLSDEYVDSHTKLRWRCSEGHEWESDSHHIKRGQWCRKCGGTSPLSLQEMQNIAKTRGGLCLSKIYHNAKTKLLWKCSEGHEWKNSPGHIKKGQWCPYCAGKAKLSIDEMRGIAKSRGGSCLSNEYVDASTKLKWQCSEGHIWNAVPGSVKYQNSWCPTCANIKAGENRRDNISNMQDIAKERDGECLSEVYVNAKSKLMWQCSEGHIWEASPTNIKTGTWCPICGRKSGKEKLKDTIHLMHQIAEQRGGKCLSKQYINNRTYLEWECSEGHKWKNTPGHIKKGQWCPVCAQGISERICRETFERIFQNKFPNKRPKWLVNPKTKRPLELDGYCEILGIAFEYQGIQHDQEIDFFHSSGRDFKEQVNLDQLKRKLCIEHGVTLIEVPSMTHDKIASFIVSSCKVCGIEIKHIPLDIYDFKSFDIYSPHKIDEMREIANSRGGKCLSNKYVNSATKLTWKCSKGHVWDATPNSIKRGSWCSICIGNKPLTIKEMQEIAKSRQGECLSNKYVNSSTHLRWRCSEGHEWNAVPSSIKSGTWCPNCAKTIRVDKQKGTIEKMRILAKRNHGKCLSNTYVDSKTKLKWRCSEGHEWESTPGHIKQGQWCPVCANRVPLTIGLMQEMARIKGGECLSEKYIDNRTKLKWKCSKSHEWEATPSGIRGGTWCPYCYGNVRSTIEEMKQLAKNRRGFCLSNKYTNNYTKLRWQCSEGHEWDSTPKHVKKGHWCPYCANIQNGLKKRDTIENMKMIAKERGGKCLSNKYANQQSILKWRCSQGHAWVASAGSVKNGTWCPICGRKKAHDKLRLSITKMKRFAESKGGKCLSKQYIIV